MSILNKLAKVKIDPTKSLLKPEDLEFCTQTEKDFLSAYSFYETKLEFLAINKPDLEGNKFLRFSEMNKSVEASIADMARDFVERIIRYFVDTYKITLNEGEIKSKLFSERCFDNKGDYYHRGTWGEEDDTKESIEKVIKIFKIPLDKILALITDKLDGMTLDEKAEQEIKDKFHDGFVKRYHKDRLEIVKNRIEFENTYIQFDYYNGVEFAWRSKEKLTILFKALSFFETRETSGIISEYNSLMNAGKVDSEVMFSEWKIGSEKVSGIRFYKNAKLVIKFVSDEVANEFYKEMCRSGL
jgi:hypothetical protein